MQIRGGDHNSVCSNCVAGSKGGRGPLTRQLPSGTECLNIKLSRKNIWFNGSKHFVLTFLQVIPDIFLWDLKKLATVIYGCHDGWKTLRCVFLGNSIIAQTALTIVRGHMIAVHIILTFCAFCITRQPCTLKWSRLRSGSQIGYLCHQGSLKSHILFSYIVQKQRWPRLSNVGQW